MKKIWSGLSGWSGLFIWARQARQPSWQDKMKGKTKPYRAARQNEGQDKKYARKGTVSPLVGLSVKKISKTSKIGKTT